MKIIYVNCGERDKYGSDLRNIEHNLSSSEIKAWKKPEYLHKVSDVYHNNYLTQCLNTQRNALYAMQCFILHRFQIS